MVGVYMPPHFLNYLGLYVIFTGLTKATPLRTAFHNWVKSMSEELPEKKLIENVVSKYQNEWNALKSVENENRSTDEFFEFFKNTISKEMAKKDVSYEICKKILTKLKV